MNTDQITDKLNAIVEEHLRVPKDTITPATAFIDDLGADGLDIVELTMAYEEEFDIKITDEEAEKCLTVGAAISLIERKLAEKEGGVVSTSHTHGPWWVDNSITKGRPGIESEAFTIVLWHDSGSDRDDGGVFGRTPDEALANARLIAAAPELLEALEDLLNDGQDHPLFKIKAARAAIAKATGKESP